jgi:hypothetical protein
MNKTIIGLIVALIAIIVVGFVALNFVPHGDLPDLNLTANDTNVTEDVNVTVVENQTNLTANATAKNDTAIEDANANATNSSVDPGDVLHKQTFVVTENETGQHEGMEPGTYVMYYTENDGIIKVDKIA